MSGDPLISVVMSVYNDARHVATTLDSVLSQEGVDLEFIVIDDGSTDETGQILDGYAALDPRLHVVHQGNTGLTRALIHGCDLAKGKYIARQDGGGDVSLSRRLRAQLELLELHSDVVMTSCGTRFMGPVGEELYEIVQRSDELQRGLQERSVDRIRGPSHHGSTMFLRSAYRSVGGYRPEFAVGQDLDLWLRLVELGRCSATPAVLYQARLSPESISAKNRNRQIKVTRIMIKCAKRRRLGLNEMPLLPKSGRFLERDVKSRPPLRYLRQAQFYYFLGSVLIKKNPERAKYYFKKSLRCWFIYPRAIIQLLFLEVKIFI